MHKKNKLIKYSAILISHSESKIIKLKNNKKMFKKFNNNLMILKLLIKKISISQKLKNIKKNLKKYKNKAKLSKVNKKIKRN